MLLRLLVKNELIHLYNFLCTHFFNISFSYSCTQFFRVKKRLPRRDSLESFSRVSRAFRRTFLKRFRHYYGYSYSYEVYINFISQSLGTLTSGGKIYIGFQIFYLIAGLYAIYTLMRINKIITEISKKLTNNHNE